MVFLKDFLGKVDFEKKNQQTIKSMKIYPGGKELSITLNKQKKITRIHISFTCNSLQAGQFCMHFSVCYFFTITFSKDYVFSNTFRVSNDLDPYQARLFFGPDLGPKCLQRLPADVTSSLIVNLHAIHLICTEQACIDHLEG